MQYLYCLITASSSSGIITCGCRDKTIGIILISIIISMMPIFSLIKQGIIMEKVLKTLLNILLYTILSVFLVLSSLAFLLGLAEGDLSHGLFYYLQ